MTPSDILTAALPMCALCTLAGIVIGAALNEASRPGATGPDLHEPAARSRIIRAERDTDITPNCDYR